MRSTPSLRPQPPRFPLEVHPLARLHVDGSLELLQAAFPPLGHVHLALWRPGEDPAFGIVAGMIQRGWRFERAPAGARAPSAAADAWVVAWCEA